MLRTRLWMGAVLIALTVGMLAVDRYAEPWYPFLFVFFTAVAGLGTVELLNLLAPAYSPRRWLCLVSVLAVACANWPAHVGAGGDAWHHVLAAFAAVVLAAFLAEMATFREPGGSVVRVALTLWVVAYLALLPSFLAQLRWMPNGAAALALGIFVPKCCDIGAYFTGRALGRHRMTLVLSPKKTWEGLAGGLVAAAGVAFGINRGWPVLSGDLSALGFGLLVGIAGVLGDLAESLIKRDCQRKDASAVVPGFGGALDVVDAVIFAAPVAYCWIRCGI
jgi:phosphatidate cytidylyltransferase